MMRYPDRSEMMAYLGERYARLVESWTDTAEIAVYWFADAWHGSLGCPLYGVLCTSPYRPGPCMRLDKEDDIVREMVAALEAHFDDGLPFDENLER